MSAPARPCIEQLRSLRPPLPESDIAREANALDAAIAQIEARYGSQVRRSVLRSLAPGGAVRLAPRRQAGRFAAAFAETRRADRARPARSFPAPGYARIPAERADGGVSRSVREPVAAAVPSRVASAAGRDPVNRPFRCEHRRQHRHPLGPSRPSARRTRPAAPAGKPAAAAPPEAPPGRPQPASAGARPASSPGAKSRATSSAIGGERRQRGQFPAAARSR